ncbi:hypothetical protein LEP1GSC170_4760 [Leptospira interrogans serovar Bataviae str. HAI135]|nr:hypothetical protein LEP1GSC170_4760 [Leptospira interrogans serovar Bataviae str. HAI135]
MREIAFEESIKADTLSSFNRFKDSNSFKNRLISLIRASSPISFFRKRIQFLEYNQ